MKNLLLAISFVFLSTSVALAGAIDLTTWTATPGGTWNVQGGGTSVLQTTNGSPTKFLSDIDYINKEFIGSFGVETASDDDFIGFVFGYTSESDYLLFDWKQGDQTGAYEGFTLSRISGGVPATNTFWNKSGDYLSVLATDYSTTKGWANNTTYEFVLDYTTTGIIIKIDGDVIFDITGVFNTGKFGFYNYSQADVRYSGFEEDQSQNAVPVPGTMLLLGCGILGLAGLNRKKR